MSEEIQSQPTPAPDVLTDHISVSQADIAAAIDAAVQRALYERDHPPVIVLTPKEQSKALLDKLLAIEHGDRTVTNSVAFHALLLDHLAVLHAATFGE
jgi:hypothetical protein